MILRRIPQTTSTHSTDASADVLLSGAEADETEALLHSKPLGWGGSPLRWRLSLVSAVMVAIAVGFMTVVAYWAVSTSLTSSVDTKLEERATTVLSNSLDPSFLYNITAELESFKDYNPDIRITYFAPGSLSGKGDSIQIVDEVRVLSGAAQMSIRTDFNERILAMRNDYGAVVILAQNLESTHQLITSLGIILLFIGALGVLMAIATGMVVARTGLRPVARLQQAVNYVTRTNELVPIEVVGDDELAQLTRSFNTMLSALQASRNRQAELVADAGHELKTPLTSLRTNIELLMMVTRSKDSALSPEDLQELERDVVAQIEEMSTLIGDLVDLARDEGPQQVLRELDLCEVMETSLERVQRRRPDVTFTLKSIPWIMDGDPFALGRATLNLMDNAAKWSPVGGVVRIEMVRIDPTHVRITFADSGPGIPVEDRERVFQRFYRSVQSRSMPGSGLGLAIVKQVIERHHGTIVVGDSDDGGALMICTLPGKTPAHPEKMADTRESDVSFSSGISTIKGNHGAEGEKEALDHTGVVPGAEKKSRRQIFGDLWTRGRSQESEEKNIPTPDDKKSKDAS